MDGAAAAGSVLLGALAASMVAGRFAVLGAVIAVIVAVLVTRAAPWPQRPWYAALAWGSLFAIGLNLYLTPGADLGWPHAWGSAATEQGLRAGILLSLRLAGAALAIHGLRHVWPGERVADELAARMRGLERVGVPVRSLRAVLALALRFAPLVAAEQRRIARLQELRRGRPARTMRDRLELGRATVVPGFVSALETAERVALGLEARHHRLRPVSGSRGGWRAALAGWTLFVTALLWRA